MKYSEIKQPIKSDKAYTLINNKEIEVLQYLPISDKIDLIQIALQKAEENGIYNEMKLDVYFNLYLVYMYTNLEFTDEEKEDEFALYDELQSNNVIISVIGAMDKDEYDFLWDYLNIMKKSNLKYKKSAAALIQSFIQDMPKNAAAAANIVDNFDKEKYQNVLDFAKAANGDRPIPSIK